MLTNMSHEAENKALVKLGVIAPSGRNVCERVRLAGAWDCLACVRGFAGGLRASARQFVCSQMRYNVSRVYAGRYRHRTI